MTIRVAAVGDLMLGDSAITVGYGLRSAYPGHSLSSALSGLSPRLRAADVAIGNLECVLTDAGVGSSRWARDQMRGDPSYARVLRDTGFTALSVANNHALQHGELGFQSTVAALRSEGLLVVGLRGTEPWHATPAMFSDSQGAVVAILGYSWRPRQFGEGRAPYADVQRHRVLEDVSRARDTCDSVIVSLHWGEEFVGQPSSDEIEFAHALVEHGADLIIGHHPHVVRPVELRGTAVIAYSLGNGATDMLWQDVLREGILLEVELGPRPTNLRLTSTSVDPHYQVHLRNQNPDLVRSSVSASSDEDYRAAARSGLARQRVAAYRYAIRNAYRLRPSVVASLFAATVANKVRGVAKRVLGAKS